jgi:hypothetical protein
MDMLLKYTAIAFVVAVALVLIGGLTSMMDEDGCFLLPVGVMVFFLSVLGGAAWLIAGAVKYLP